MQRFVVVCLTVLAFATLCNGRPSLSEDEGNHRNKALKTNPVYTKIKNRANIQGLPFVVLSKEVLTDAFRNALVSIVKEEEEDISTEYNDDNGDRNYKTQSQKRDIQVLYGPLGSKVHKHFLPRPKRNKQKKTQEIQKKQKQMTLKSLLSQNKISPELSLNELQNSIDSMNANLKLINSILLQTVEDNGDVIKHSRVKRDASKELRSNNTNSKPDEVINNKNVTMNTYNKVSDKKQGDKVLENTTDAINETENPPNDPINIDGRRMYREDPPKIVTSKLLGYLDLTYEEILNKLKPLSKIKGLYSNDESYKIGYILANIDTLEANIKILKKDMDENRISWTDVRILEHFDKLMVSNQVITNLVEALNTYTKYDPQIDAFTRLVPEN